MNKDIIQELAKKAGLTVDADGEIGPTFYGSVSNGYEKFAELLIAECRSVITDFDDEDDFECMINPRSVRWDCDCEIRDHFGIEQ